MVLQNSDPSLKRYLDDIRNTRPMTRQEEQEMFRHLAKGSRAARERLVSCNMRFVLKVAMQYRGCPIPLSDLVNEGSLGLIRAIESYEESRGYKFISYAVWWIKAYITRCINENASLVRLPANQHLRVRKALRLASQGEEIPLDIQDLITIGGPQSSLDMPLTPESKSSVADVLADPTTIDPGQDADRRRMEELAAVWLAELPPREAMVIQGVFGMYDGIPKTLREVGVMMGISHERTRQLRDQALRRIRKSAPKELLRERFESYVAIAC